MLELLKSHKCFEGQTQFWSHFSKITQTEMKLATYTPDTSVRGCLIWLSGLTCNEENFMTKAASQKYLAAHGLMVVAPDTSPRGLSLEGEHESYDFGSGAGFYLTATRDGYKDHYKMDEYITCELVDLIQKKFNQKYFSLFGHSMGGHGALTLGLKNPNLFQSISAFSPIVNPTQTPWGQKAFQGYLGDDRDEWKMYDATELVLSGHQHKNSILIDQGTGDEFYQTELFPEELSKACQKMGQPLELNLIEGYDHSYYFISSFIERHIQFHSQYFS